MSLRPIKTARARKRGILPSLWEQLVGERDPVADQLHALARQGTWTARSAHLCAVVMLVLFSLGALVGIAGDSTTIFLTAWQRGELDLIHGLAAGVSAAFVLCMDVTSIAAALRLRTHATRRMPWRARLIPLAVIVLADALEAGSIAYMTWRYDPPAIVIVWALIIARDIAAPLYAVYLSLEQPLPVSARDVLHLVEMAAGAGMARDAIRLANDPDAPLERKPQLFVAASESANRTTQQDLERLWYLLQVLTTTTDAHASGLAAGDGAEAGIVDVLPPPHRQARWVWMRARTAATRVACRRFASAVRIATTCRRRSTSAANAWASSFGSGRGGTHGLAEMRSCLRVQPIGFR